MNTIITIISLFTALASLIASMFWNKKQLEAKDERIKVIEENVKLKETQLNSTIEIKDLEINNYKEEVRRYKELCSPQFLESVESAKKYLENYNKELLKELNKLKECLKEKEEKINELQNNSKANYKELEYLLDTKTDLSIKIHSLADEINLLSSTKEKLIDSLLIPKNYGSPR